MVTATAGDIVDLIVHWEDSGGNRAQTHHGFYAETSLGTWETLASTFKTQFVKNTSGGLLSEAGNTVSISQLDVMDVKPGTTATYSSTFTTVVGSNASPGDLLPQQCAGVITWRTATRGRSYRGRTYMPFILEGRQANGTLDSTMRGAYAAFATAFLAYYGEGGTDGDWRAAVISRILNGVERVTPVATLITSYTVQTPVYTQRRRRSGQGA